MNIIFMGTPDFAIPSLKKINESKHNIIAVVTAPDKERGRGQKVSFTPVKQFALDNNIPVLQPEKLKDENFISRLKEFNADLFVVVAFKILPKEVFDLPEYGSFNLHASLLPKYRGAAPIHWALIRGEKKTGVTTFKLEEKVDTGNIYLQEKIYIEDSDSLESVYNKLSKVGAEAVLKTIDLIERGNYKLKHQNNSLATPAPKITKETGRIDWEKSAKEIHNLIRGLSPSPGAYFFHDDKMIKIYKSEIVYADSFCPGEIYQTKNDLIFGCGKNAIAIIELQQEGRKRMNVEEFLRGFSFV